MFLWLCLHRKLLTNSERVKRHLSNCGLCGRCKNGDEDITHALRDCWFAQSIWLKLVPTNLWTKFFSMKFDEWLMSNLGNKLKLEENWPTIFGTTCWSIWRYRNAELFDENFKYPIDPAMEIRAKSKMFLEASQILQEGKRNEKKRMERLVGWNIPSRGWIKVNSDGALHRNPLRAAAGGLLRNDDEGEWIARFTANVGICSVLQAELWGAIYRLRLAWSMGYRRVILEVDNRLLVDMVVGKAKGGVKLQTSLEKLSSMRR